MAVTKRLSKNDGAILAALALSAYYFPSVDAHGVALARFAQAAFLVGGHYDTWASWRTMSHQERQRITAVLRSAPEELCKVAKFTRRARRLLTSAPDLQHSHPFILHGDEPERADAAVPRVGGDLLGYADRILERLRKDHPRRRPQKIAGEGVWLTRTRYSPGIGLVQGKVTIPDFGESAGNPDAFDVKTVPYRAEVSIDTEALLEIAGQIDQRYRSEDQYVQRVLSDLFRQMDTTDNVKVGEVLRLVAGPMEILNAPTGTGKSVFVRVAASWFALEGLTITLVLPTVDATLSIAYDIQEDLKKLCEVRSLPHELICTPLMSPYGLHERALKAGARVEGSFLGQSAKSRWRVDQLAYGCALGPLTEINAPFPPGSESCRTLTPLPPKLGSHACPWMTTTCGKFEQPRRAIVASVIVTNHHNFMVGRFPLSLVLDGRQVDDVSIAEFLFRRSHGLMIDEVDQFQSTALGMCASELVLDTRRNYAIPLKDLDDDKSRLPIEAAKDLCPTISHARYLSEFLLAGICTNDIHLRQYEGSGPARDQQGLNTTGWHLAGGRDRRLIMLLFPDAGITNEQEVPNELFGLLNALGPTHPGIDDQSTITVGAKVELPEHLRAVRASLEKVLAPRGEDLLSQVKLELADALRSTITDAHLRSEAIELLLVRTWLRELDAALALLRNKTAQLRSVGLPSARKLAERLESRVAADILPYGMLGGAIVGYRVTGLDDAEKSAELTAQCISGDPHTYTAQLGSVVSLVLAGVERPVMGLSATAYFPQAVREHVRAEVKWWMTDAAPDSIRARRHMITDAVDKPIQISGIPQALKRRALITLGEQLYDKQIHHELAKIAKTDPARAHAAVVVNSYEHCRHIALGIRGSSLYTGGLCVAVPPDKERRDRLPPLPPGIIELTPDEFETFPSRGTILVVPMARIARGLNIVIGTKSAITPVYLCTRPLALLTDPPEMYASINAAGLRALPSGPSADPVAALQVAREAAWERLGVIMRSAPGFVSTRPELQEEIVAGMVVDMIQLAGRARRGGTDMTLHLVDYAFHEDSWQSDLANILRRMYEQWHPDQRRQMNAIYREALAAFLAYAGIDANG